MKIEDLKHKKIDVRQEIPFQWKTDKFGWASFDVCQVWKNRKIRKIYIVPIQQNLNEVYVFEPPKDYKISNFDIMSYAYQYTDVPFEENDATVNGIGYCEYHNAIRVEIKVPKKSSKFNLSLNFGDTLGMEFR